MQLLTAEIKQIADIEIIKKVINKNFDVSCLGIEEVIKKMYDEIPEDKRISYGIVHTVKTLGEYLFKIFEELNIPVFDSASSIFSISEKSESKTVALCILSFYGLNDFEKVLPFFIKAAADDDWEVREIAQMLFRKLIKKYPDKAKKFLLKSVKSDNPNIRRFVGETLRPVCENKWFYKQPEYFLSVIRYLFKESKAYPRTSAGNNLSDLARHQPELVYNIVKELVENGDKNSYWIAYRACRNLVKKEPERVLKLLKTDIYKYKDRIHESEKINI